VMHRSSLKLGATIIIGLLLVAAMYVIEAKRGIHDRLRAFVVNSYENKLAAPSSTPSLAPAPSSAASLSLTPLPTSQITPDLNLMEGSRHIKLLFLGDVMLGRYVRTLMEKKSHDYPFELVRESLLSDKFDRVIANLEGPIVEVPNRAQSGTNFGFAPDTAKILKRNGIDIVSIANNHTLDQGEKGFESTKKYLAENAVEFFGNPILPTESEVLIKEINNKTFAFVGFHDAVRRLDDKKAIDLVKKIDPQVDHVIIFIHWGQEYKKTPSQRQRELARAFIESGADLIIGHHPHVTQTIEDYKGVHIVYSLGNFIFDQYWSRETQKGTAIEAVFSSSTGDDSIQLFEHPIDLPESRPKWLWE